ncbi:hypothetical protein [Bifidobacterium asteroides]|uniref:hypothetical protein n=1 Tax=Bifidobacterium asteroides TaxID=1684 RepID=UPI0018DC51B4|nr:hypothetical protein [Bifidobacterium asteroides]MBH9984472.1 hypothetical protein [Bifidobacterium asteroides]
MDIQKLFTGLAVVIDDEIANDQSTISSLIDKIEEQFNLFFVKLTKYPNDDKAEALSYANMIILDWMFEIDSDDDSSQMSSPEEEPNSDGVSPDGFSDSESETETPKLPSGSAKETEEDKIKTDLIRQLLKASFAPIFIITNDKSLPKTAIEGEHDLKPYLGGRLVVVGKGELENSHDIQNFLENWLNLNHESYLLKEWDITAKKAKQNFFMQYGKDNTKWADALWARLEEDDPSEFQNIMGEYLTRCIVNQMDDFSFDEELFNHPYKPDDTTDETMKQLVNDEKIKWALDDSFPVHPHAGDLYYCDVDYHFELNIRADCDTARNNSDPRSSDLYCLRGEPLYLKEVNKVDNWVDEKYNLHLYSGPDLISEGSGDVDESLKSGTISLERLVQILIGNPSNLVYLNKALSHDPLLTNIHGKLLGHRNAYYLPINIPKSRKKTCYNHIKKMIAIKFRFELATRPYSSIKDTDPTCSNDTDHSCCHYNYVGRILPPYINEIQQECAQWIVRIGSMPTPSEFYN